MLASCFLPPVPLDPHDRIESLTLERSPFFNDFHLDFPDGITVIFGGRGTGKSALFAILAFMLEATTLPQFHASQHEHARAALGGGKATLVLVTQYGVRYRVERRWGEPARVYAEDGRLAFVSLNGPLFKVEIYGQKVIEEIGRDDAAKRALIDKFAEAETQRLEGELARLEAQLAENADAQRRLSERIEEDHAGTLEIPAIEGALAGLDVAAKLDVAEAAREGERKRARGRERRAVASVHGAIEAARAELEEAARVASRRLAATVEGALEEGPLGAQFREAHAAARGASGAIEVAWAKLRDDLAAFERRAGAAARAIGVAHHTEDEAYHAFVARSDASLARAAERQTLHLRLEELAARKRRVDELQGQLEQLEAARAVLVKEHERLVLAVRACREATAARLNDTLAGAVNVTIDGAGDASAYKTLLGELLKKSGTRPDLDAIVEALRPARLAALVRGNDPAPLEAVDRSKTDRAERAVKIVSALRSSGRLAELECARPLDVVRLDLQVSGKPIASEKASVGQRCTCVIEALLAPSTNGLAVDQVEDHLDGAFVYQVLVRKLLAEKVRRQFILVSHSPNIAALAEAELVVLLGLDENGGSHLAAHGNYVAMAGKIESWLEGGAEAFLRRGELYGHFPKRQDK